MTLNLLLLVFPLNTTGNAVARMDYDTNATINTTGLNAVNAGQHASADSNKPLFKQLNLFYHPILFIILQSPVTSIIMKPTLPYTLSNKKASKKLFLFFVMISFAATVFAQAPAITSFSPASGPVGTLVTINGNNLAAPTSLSIGGVTALVVNNSGTVLTGFVMPGAVTGAISLTTSGGTATGGSNFTITPTAYPALQQGGKLVGTGNTGAAQQGWSVAVSADGNTAIVGAPSDNNSVGAAWVYTRNNSVWVQQGNKLVGTGNVGASKQGFSVALSADGNTAIMGGEGDDADGSGDVVGAAWIFTRSGGTWSQQGNKLVGTGWSISAAQGWSVALSADGNTAIVGGIADGAVGAAWIFTRSAGTWSQQGSKLVGDGGIEEAYAVALSADGNTAIMSGSANTGAAWIFVRNGVTWSQQGSMLVDAAEGNQVPTSVSLSADGNTAIVGGFNGGVSGAFVYTRSSNTWTEQGSIQAGNGTSTASESTSVSLSADGNTAIVSGTTNSGQQGAAWIYTRSGGTWSQQGSALPGGVNTDQTVQGASACLSADGSTALVGGWADNSSQGAAWVYATPPAITSFSPAKGPVGTLVTINGTNLGTPTSLSIGGVTALIINGTGTVLTGFVMPGAATGPVSLVTNGVTATAGGNFTVTPTQYPVGQQSPKLVATGVAAHTGFGSSVSVSADGNTAVVGGFGDNTGVGALWVYTRIGGTWSQQGSKLVATGTIGQAKLGVSVAISADGNTIIAGASGDNSLRGAAWVFTRSGNTWTQQGGKLVGTGSVDDATFGNAVSISADGNTAIVGGQDDNEVQGAVWVFTRSAGVWTQQGSKLVGTGSVGQAGQGFSVAISADGNTVIEGGDEDNGNFGAAWVFTLSGGVWSQQGSKLFGAGSGTGNRPDQGYAVSLSADGNTALVGGVEDSDGIGAMWVYTRSGGVWSQQGNKLVGTGWLIDAEQGNAVSLSADGNTAILGGSQDSGDRGAMWVFTRSNGTWSQQGSKRVGTNYVGNAAESGSVSLSADGTTVMEGGVQDNNATGAVWVFASTTNPLLSSIKLTPASILTSTGTVGSTTTYTTSVVNATASVTVTATAQDPNATIAVNGTAVTSGTASGAIALAEGANTTITTVVTSADGTATMTYAIIVTRAPSADASLSNLATSSGTLTPAFAAGTVNYTATVTNATTGVTVTPTSTDANAAITVNGTPVLSGTASANIALSAGANNITSAVTSQDGSTTDTYSIVVNRQSNNAALSTIKLTPATALTNTGTSGTTTTYTASVVNAIASVTVTPTAQNANAAITVNGVAVAPGTASGPVALAEGAITTITTVVTSEDGTATRTYSITITRAPSPDASLSNLVTSSGTLTPAFAAGTLNYTANVTSATTGITVTPTSTDPNATITVNGTTVLSGTASANIAVANAINIVVKAQDGTTTGSYSIVITKKSSNAVLSTIKLTPATALTNTGTSGTTTTYTASVANATASVTVTPTSQDATATIKVNGVTVTSGTASGAIALAEGGKIQPSLL